MGLGCFKMVIHQNVKLNINVKYFSTVLSDDEVGFLEETQFIKELKLSLIHI